VINNFQIDLGTVLEIVIKLN